MKILTQAEQWPFRTSVAKDITLYRGYGLDFREPGLEKLKAITHPHFDNVPGESLGEAYARSQRDEKEGNYTDPQLGPIILDYLSKSSPRKGYQLGSHWTTDPSVARDWATGRGRTPVVVKATIPTSTKKDTFNPGWKYEKEWPMTPGTPVTVQEVHLHDPRSATWSNVLQQSSPRLAGR